ncbi:DUF4331 domain-containing protein [Luteolibacter sp. LG18]|uniref:DUF4331 domain-containing protein n=1 Tax=Luteolibacter sp. LG18 TaxID=2819286 RepID=UPI002B2B4E8C|nr:hypothetical protein llg_11310 [Luteolibacter sp. LG18]
MKKYYHPSGRNVRISKAPKAFTAIAGAALAAGGFLSLAPLASASSHSDAPLIKLDPQANLTDVYAFVRTRPTGEKVLVVSVAVRPFSEPGDGSMYDAFSPDALYSIHITNPTTGIEAQRYDFRFSAVSADAGNYKNTDTILRYGRGAEIGPIQTVGDARQNFVQSYTVVKTVGNKKTTLNSKSTPLLVPPPNVGINTTPLYNDDAGAAVSGATTRAELDPYTFQTVYDLAGGTTVFAGPREDGFYADTPGIFDLLESRILDNNGSLADGLGQDGNGVDGFKGYNVLTYSIVIPLADLPSFPYTGALQPASTGVGVYASVSRPRLTLRSANGDDVASGAWVQVNRLANPLFNEVLVAIADKDNYNRTSPKTDAKLFAKYASNPEIAVLINAVYGTQFQTTNRADLVGVFIPDVIRVNTTTGPVHVSGEPGFNRLSFIGSDTVATSSGAMIPSGWPNGRRFGDDVVDIALTAVASGPTFSTITVVGDNVSSNDQVYNQTFPYAATPHAGPANSKDSGPNVGF